MHRALAQRESGVQLHLPRLVAGGGLLSLVVVEHGCRGHDLSELDLAGDPPGDSNEHCDLWRERGNRVRCGRCRGRVASFRAANEYLPADVFASEPPGLEYVPAAYRLLPDGPLLAQLRFERFQLDEQRAQQHGPPHGLRARGLLDLLGLAVCLLG